MSLEKTRPLKLKLCLIGESCVGKTSLIKRYVSNQFDDRYLRTLGTKITKKEMKVHNPKNDELIDVDLSIWDVVDQESFHQLLRHPHFSGTQGIIGVCDITKKNTISKLRDWMESAQRIAEEIPIVLLGNKCDLEDEQQMELNELQGLASGYGKAVSYPSSAKTGFNVDIAFKTLSEKILEDML